MAEINESYSRMPHKACTRRACLIRDTFYTDY